MSDPSAALQVALVAALRADAGVAALVAARIYDRVPADATFPYIEIGNIQALDDGADCVDGTEAFVDLHVYTRSVGLIECRRVASVIRDALHEQPLALAGHALIDMRVRQIRTFAEADTLTGHAVLELRALTEAT